jgi:YD repeat-containing protein
MTNRFKKCLSVGIFILILVSCSKNSNTAPVIPVNNCKIIAASIVSGTTTANYTFAYNSDGKLSGSVYAGAYGDTITYTYNGNTIYRSVAAGAHPSLDTISVNNAGFMLQDKDVVAPNIYMTNYVYDVNQELKTITQQENSYPPISVSFTFTNGDNTQTTQGSFVDTLVYDTNKPAVTGNLDQFNQLLAIGAMYIKNAHLIVSESHGTTTTYSYTYTTEGNISTIKMTTGNNSSTISYTYNCN